MKILVDHVPRAPIRAVRFDPAAPQEVEELHHGFRVEVLDPEIVYCGPDAWYVRHRGWAGQCANSLIRLGLAEHASSVTLRITDAGRAELRRRASR